MSDPCPTCDRADCPYLPFAAMEWDVFDVADWRAEVLRLAALADCRANAVDWRAEVLRLRAEFARTRDVLNDLRDAYRKALQLAEEHVALVVRERDEARLTHHEACWRTGCQLIAERDDARAKLAAAMRVVEALADADPEDRICSIKLSDPPQWAVAEVERLAEAWRKEHGR